MITTERAPQSLADDLASALDPVAFARSAGVEPDSWQAEVLRSHDPRILMNCSRQSGKSTVAAILALHRATFYPGSLVLLLSPSLRQSSELFRTAANLYTASGASVPPKGESALRLELENGSRVISLPATQVTIRGFSAVSLLICDEASRIEDSLYMSVRPMLATSQGRLIALSTPYGKRGWWSDSWHSAHDWKRVQITAEQCARISPEFLEEEWQQLGDWWYQQEYLCRFLDAQSQAFRSEDIAGTMIERTERWAL